MKKSLFLTGANGFIGSHIAEKAVEKNYQVFALIRSNADITYIKDLPIELIEVDYFNYRQLLRTFKRFEKIELFIHCAGVTESESEAGFESGNVQVTQNILKTLSAAKLDVNHFLLLSSLAARGPHKSNGDKEQPISGYGRSKLKAERILRDFDFSYSIVRPTAVYGPRDKAFLELVRLVKWRIEIGLGNPNRKLTFIHADDLCELIFHTAKSKEDLVYGWDHGHYSESDLTEPIKRAFGVKKTLKIQIPTIIFLRLTKVMNWLIQNLKGQNWTYTEEKAGELAADWQISEELNEFKPMYDLESGIRQTISWYRDNGLV